MRSKFAIVVFLFIVGFCRPTLGQPYGLDQPQPMGAYLNGVFPHTAPSSTASWFVEVAFTNIIFDQPIFMLPYPGTNRLVMVHKTGRITTFPNRRSALQSEEVPFLDISGQTFTVSDSGLTGCVFHPEFGVPGSTNRGYFYITYKWRPASVGSSNPDFAYIRLSRFTVADGQTVADPNSEVVLLQQFDRQEFHDAGCLMFGADGYLYFSIGDEGGANDEFNVTQIINERLLSGVFRIDVNKNAATSHPIRRQPFHHPAMPAGWPESFSTNYLVPNDNPFVKADGSVLEEYYALGCRQPYRFSRDPVTRLIWLADSGQSTREEIDILVPGANYQWAYREGSVPGPKASPAVTNGFEKTPLFDYGRDFGGCAIGGYVYRGLEHAGFLTGKYIWADNVSGRISAITSDGVTLSNVEYLANMPSGSVYGGTSSCALDGQGEIYFLKFGGDGSGQVFKLSRISTVIPDPPALLSQVGAFTNLSTLAPARGLIPYNVNAPLWSDGAAKSRWLAMPSDGTNDTLAEKISFSPTNDWQFPAGTVFIKHFELPVDQSNPSVRKRLETRFIVRDDYGGVYGVTYKWRDEGSDADLLTAGATNNYSITTTSNTTQTQAWSFPSRQDCVTCHNANAHGVLGLKTHQLNGNFTYPQTGRTDNQLRTFGHLGLFTSGFDEAQTGNYLISYNLTNTSRSPEDRVRSYIDSNCSHCHRPGGQRANFDARYITPLESQNLIYGAVIDSINDSSDRVVRPQDLVHSLMYNRANRVGTLQMPPIAKNLVDTQAIQVMSNWIASLPTGPGVTLSLAQGNANVSGPFTVNVSFTESVNGVTASQFNLYNAQITNLSGAGSNYSIVVAPQVRGPVTVQFAANRIVGATGQPNYTSNPLAASYDPLNASLNTRLSFDESSGNTAADASGNGNPGTLSSFVLAGWTNGLFGNALYFDGVSDYVGINNTITSDFTICCWLKTTQQFLQADPTYNGTGIIWSDVGGVANDFIFGGTRDANGFNRLSFFAGGSETTVSGLQPINTGQWVHTAVTLDGTTGLINLYVNGVLDATGVGSTNLLNANPIINIGGNTLDGHFYNGLIDDVRIYSRVLAPSELATLLVVTPPSIALTTSNITVTNAFTVTATFSEVVTGFSLANINVQNGYASQFAGNGGVYTFVVTPKAPGLVAVQVLANVAIDANHNGNLASTTLMVNAVNPEVSTSGLVGCWTFDETNNTLALDSSGRGNNGVLQNLNNSKRVPGLWGTAFDFNGTNSYISVSNILGSNFTISMWIKTTQVFPQTDDTYGGTGLFWSDVGGAHNDFVFGANRTAAGVNRLSFFTGGPDSSVNGTKAINTGKWTHLAVTRNKTTGERRLYVNGMLDVNSFAGTATLTDNPLVSIGGNTLDGRYFKGQMDEVRVYNRVLSDAEVGSIAANGGYVSWAASMMPNASVTQSAPFADPDGDGQPNLLEYALDTNPLGTNSTPFTIRQKTDGTLQLNFPRRTGYSGLVYVVMKSNNLTDWFPLPPGTYAESTVPVSGKDLEMVTDQILYQEQQAFFRLQVFSTAP